jgi:hypothetical protein
MKDSSPFEITNRPHLQIELFCPSVQYPSHAYAEILSKTAVRYPENEAVIWFFERVTNSSLLTN